MFPFMAPSSHSAKSSKASSMLYPTAQLLQTNGNAETQHTLFTHPLNNGQWVAATLLLRE